MMDARTLFACVFGLLLALAALAFGFGVGGSKPKARKGQPTVLIAGPSGSGKTCLFYRWQSPDSAKETVTSVAPNEDAHFSLNPACRIIDCPGNEKLSQQTLKLVSESNLKAIVFVIDAAAGLDAIRNSAKPLVSILELSELNAVPVVIAANKFDMFSAVSVPKIRSLLEQEITELRSSRQQTVPSSEDDGWNENEKEFLGVDGKEFEFRDLQGYVEVLDGSVKLGKTQKWEAGLEQVL